MAVTHTETVNGTDYGFDFDDQEVEVEAGVSSSSADDIKEACRLAEWSQTGIVWGDIIDTSNPVTLDAGAGISTALNVIFQDTWDLLSLSTSGLFSTEGGNVVHTTDGVDIYAPNTLITYVNNVSQAGVRIGADAADASINRIEQIVRNRQIVNDTTNKMEIYDDTDTSILWEADIYEDDGVTAWDGTGPIVRRNRFEEP